MAAAEPSAGSEPDLASLVRDRGAPLLEALESHLPGAGEHAEATGSYAFAVAVEIGYDRAGADLVREAAKLHEVGKIYVPADLLAKPPEELTGDERAQLDDHHESGYRLGRGAGVPDGVCGSILRVRERFDGSGPERLTDGEIPIESRIIRAASICHLALAAPDAAPAGPDERRERATGELYARAGTELDPAVVDAFAAVLARASEPGR